jgi:hypothetical protein
MLLLTQRGLVLVYLQQMAVQFQTLLDIKFIPLLQQEHFQLALFQELWKFYLSLVALVVVGMWEVAVEQAVLYIHHLLVAQQTNHTLLVLVAVVVVNQMEHHQHSMD